MLLMFGGSSPSVIVIMTAITILQQPVSAGYGAAYAFVMGNLAGGLAATFAYLLVSLFPAPAVAFACRAALRTGFRRQDCGRRRIGPIYAVALVTFLIVLGLGLTPLPTDSGAIFISRVFNVFSPPPIRSASPAFCGGFFEHNLLTCLPNITLLRLEHER